MTVSTDRDAVSPTPPRKTAPAARATSAPGRAVVPKPRRPVPTTDPFPVVSAETTPAPDRTADTGQAWSYGPRAVRFGLQMRRYNPVLQWLGQTVTLGVGHLIWLTRIGEGLAGFDTRLTGNTRRGVLAIAPGVVLLVPAFVAWYRLGRRIADAQHAAGLPATCRPWRGVLLACAFGAVTPYYQAEVNKIIDWYGYPPDAPVPLVA